MSWVKLSGVVIVGLILFLAILSLTKFSASQNQNLRLINTTISLTHACSYYSIYSKDIGKDLKTFDISKIKEVHGKLKEIWIEVLLNKSYEVEVPIYDTCFNLVEINTTNATNVVEINTTNITKTTKSVCEALGCLDYNETFCNCSYSCVVDYLKETRYKDEWATYRAYKVDKGELKLKEVKDFSKEKFPKIGDYCSVRICGDYDFEATPNGWGVAIEHIPTYLDVEYSTYDWWNGSWQYRRSITINNTQNSNTLTDYQVLINVTYNSHMNSDFSDLRFTWYNSSDSSETEIPYCIENYVSLSYAETWIKVPKIPANSYATVYVYYGNTTIVSSKSNGDSTFLFFDNGSVDKSSNYSFNGGLTLSYSNGEIVLTKNADGRGVAYYNGQQFTNVRVIAKIKRTNYDDYFGVACDFEDNDNFALISLHTGDDRIYMRHYADSNYILDNVGFDVQMDTYYIFELDNYGADYYGYIYNASRNLLVIKNFTFETRSGYAGLLVYYYNNHQAVADWWFIAKYTDPEPTYSIGEEESQAIATVTIDFNYQNPADISSINVYNTNLNISYNITVENGVMDKAILYYKTNSTNQQCWVIENGTCILSNYTQLTYTSNISNSYLWILYPDQVYPGIYNFDEDYMRNTPHQAYDLDNANDYIKVRLFNVSNITQYNYLSIMANTTSTTSMRIYYCNSSYTSGKPHTSPYCVNFFNLYNSYNYNVSNNQSFHYLVPFAVNNTTGETEGDIKITPTSYFLFRGNIGTDTWKVWYITNISRVDTVQISTNGGTSWSNFAGTVDMHLHQYYGNDKFWYYACANATDGTTNCTSERQDLIDLYGLPPTSPHVYSPTEGVYSGLITINYTESISPNSYPIVKYNITLVDLNESYVQTITSDNGLNLSYVWDSSEAPDGQYYIRVYAYDNQGQFSYGLSENITIDNTPPLWRNQGENGTQFSYNQTCFIVDTEEEAETDTWGPDFFMAQNFTGVRRIDSITLMEVYKYNNPQAINIQIRTDEDGEPSSDILLDLNSTDPGPNITYEFQPIWLDPSETYWLLLRVFSSHVSQRYEVYGGYDDAPHSLALETFDGGETWQCFDPDCTYDGFQFYMENTTTYSRIKYGDSIMLYAQGLDELSGLDYAWLETNETGEWENKTGVYNSPLDMNNTINTWIWSNFTWYNSSTPPGTTVSWRIYYNDTAGNENVTDAMFFEIGQYYIKSNPQGVSLTGILGRSVEVLKNLTQYISLTDVSKKLGNLGRKAEQGITVVIDVFKRSIPHIPDQIISFVDLVRRQVFRIREVFQPVSLVIELIVTRIPHIPDQIISFVDLVRRQVWIQRIVELPVNIIHIVSKQVSTFITLIQTLTITEVLKSIRVVVESASITVSSIVSRFVSISRVVSLKFVVEPVLSVIKPILKAFTLPVPPYGFFAYLGRVEVVLAILLSLVSISIISIIFMWRKREEYYEHPIERFFKRIKRKIKGK